MSIIRIDPPLPLETPKGRGMAHFVIDYGTEYHLLWVVFVDATGECWSLPNPEVRMGQNWTMGRRDHEKVSGQTPPKVHNAPGSETPQDVQTC